MGVCACLRAHIAQSLLVVELASLSITTLLPLVHIRALISLHQINNDECTHILWNTNLLTLYVTVTCFNLKGWSSGSINDNSSSVGQKNNWFYTITWIVKTLYLTPRILQLVTHFVDPHCYNVSVILPEDDPLTFETFWNWPSVNILNDPSYNKTNQTH